MIQIIIISIPHPFINPRREQHLVVLLGTPVAGHSVITYMYDLYPSLFSMVLAPPRFKWIVLFYTEKGSLFTCSEVNACCKKFYKSSNVALKADKLKLSSSVSDAWTLHQYLIIGMVLGIAVGGILISVIAISIQKRIKRKCREYCCSQCVINTLAIFQSSNFYIIRVSLLLQSWFIQSL